jgi:hypothetical protein
MSDNLLVETRNSMAAELIAAGITTDNHSNANTRFQSFFMLITVQARALASSISD